MQPLLSATAARALASPVETTLENLLIEYGLELGAGLLQSLSELTGCLSHFNLNCEPPIGDGGLTDLRVLSSRQPGSVEAILQEIKRLETASVEFKSSLELDRKRLLKDPGRSLPEYRSEEVLGSALKTIAAFANTGGGTLYLGVQDDGSICGLSEDFAAVNPRRPDYDGWELHLRNLIRSRFSDGPALSAYVQTIRYEKDGQSFVQAKIAPRSRLTFLKMGATWELYTRGGTQTNAIPYYEIEQHFRLTRLY
jgi:hypothetical protein